MKFRLPIRLTPLHLLQIPSLVLLGSLLLTALSTYYAVITAREKDQLRFESAIATTQNEIQKRFKTHIALLQAGTSLFAAKDEVSRQDFKIYVDHLKLPQQYPGVQGIGYSQRVQPAAKAALVAKMRQQGLTTFRLYPDNGTAETHAIIYLEPQDRRNQVAMGFNMFSEPHRRAAMSRARDTGQPAISQRVTLVQEISAVKQAGFLIYVPVYTTKQTPATITARQQALQGFVYSPFRAGDFIQGIFGQELPNLVNFQIYDGTTTNPEALLYRSSSADQTNRSARFRAQTTMDVVGQPWTMVFTSQPELEQSSEQRLIPLIILGGSLISLLLWLITRSQVMARLAAEQAAADLQQSELALRVSESRFQAFMNHNPAAAWITDSQGRFLYINPTSHQLFALPEQVIGKSMHDVYSTDFADRLLQQIESVAVSQQVMRTIETAPRPDHSPGEFLVYVFPIEDNLGERLVGGVAIDMTEQKRSQAEREQLLLQLEQNLAQMEAIIARMTEGLVVLDASGHLLLMNPTALQLHGYTDGQPEQRHLQELHQRFELRDLSGNVLTLAQWPLSRALQGEMFADQELQVRHQDTGAEWIGSFSGMPVWSKQGQVMLAVVTLRDITRQKQAEAELARSLTAEQSARAEAEAANRVKDQFLAVLSHELRTPLNPILGWVQLMRAGRIEPQKYPVALETIERNARLQVQLIEDLLDISRILQGKMSLHVAPLNLAATIEAAKETVRLAAEAKSIQICTTYMPLDGEVVGDPNRLQQVVWNLLANAVKFTDPAGQVEVRLEPVAGQAQIQVKDTGHGISAEFLPYVFESFRQADSGITRTYGGLGLGLGIARHIIEMHGGTIQADSPGEGQGAIFTVRLPLQPQCLEECCQPEANAGFGPMPSLQSNR